MKSLIQIDCSNYYIKRLFLLCQAIIFLNYCTSKKNTTVQEYPALPQNVEGFVFLCNEFGQFQQNNSGVTVFLDSTSFTTTTDTVGKFTLQNVPAGNYTITFTKSGYGTYKSSYSDYLGGETYQLPTTSLYATPTTTVTGLSAQIVDSVVQVSGVLSPAGSETQPRSALLFASLSPSVSPDNYTQAFIAYEDTGSSINFSPVLSSFSSGQMVYLVAYGASANSYYKNPVTGKLVYPFVGSTASNVATVVAP